MQQHRALAQIVCIVGLKPKLMGIFFIPPPKGDGNSRRRQFKAAIEGIADCKQLQYRTIPIKKLPLEYRSSLYLIEK
jgi:hypothetical protein